MEVCMKDTLRILRQKKHVTQEALANHLGITAQSVGKWERGEGFPDITLLPDIALYFGVTIDDLLNVGQARIDEQVNAYQEASLRYRNAGDNAQNLSLWEKAYEEFPNDCRVMDGLMHAINREGRRPCPQEDAERIIALGQRILDETRSTELRESAIQMLCYTYDSIGDKENALRYADMGGGFFTTREELRMTVLDGEEGVVACQEYMMSLVHTAAMVAGTMISKTKASVEETIHAYQFGIDILKRLFADGNVGYFAYALSAYYECVAAAYASINDKEKVLEMLQESARYSVMESKLDYVKYTAPMVNRLERKRADFTKNYVGNTCNLRLNSLQKKLYDPVREDERFVMIERELSQYAE